MIKNFLPNQGNMSAGYIGSNSNPMSPRVSRFGPVNNQVIPRTPSGQIDLGGGRTPEWGPRQPGPLMGNSPQLPQIRPNPAFESWYGQQRQAGGTFPDIMDKWEQQRGQNPIGPMNPNPNINSRIPMGGIFGNSMRRTMQNYRPPQPGQMVNNGWGGMMPYDPNFTGVT